MNKHFCELAERATEAKVLGTGQYALVNPEKFAELIYKDIMTVVAAHVLLNESALDVYKNLKRIYEES